MARFSHRFGSTTFMLVALALVGGMLAVLTLGAGAAVNTCQARNLTRGTARSADLQAVIDAANDGDTIQVKRVCVGHFMITKDLTIVGEPTRSVRKATLDGNGSGRVLLIDGFGVEVTLTNLSITGGNVVGDGGGGIWNGESDLTLNRSVVTGNTAYGAGGIVLNAGTLTLNDSSVRGNTTTRSDSPGGISAGAYDGTLVLNGSSSVRANTGCGISNNGDDVILNDSSSVRGNACRVGGGISNDDGTVIMNDSSTVTGNNADIGGGIWADGTLIMNDSSSVSGNTARYNGGGILDCGAVSGAIDGVNVFENHLADGTENNIEEC